VPILSWSERSAAQWRPRQNWGHRSSLTRCFPQRQTRKSVRDFILWGSGTVPRANLCGRRVRKRSGGSARSSRKPRSSGGVWRVAQRCLGKRWAAFPVPSGWFADAPVIGPVCAANGGAGTGNPVEHGNSVWFHAGVPAHMSRCLGTKSVGACLDVLPAPAPAPSARELSGQGHSGTFGTITVPGSARWIFTGRTRQ
jgi:hypothetical protein